MVDIDSLSFLADYVKQNRPLVIKNAISNWPALEKWKSNEYLVETMGDSEVSVASSPFGKVDVTIISRKLRNENAFSNFRTQELFNLVDTETLLLES